MWLQWRIIYHIECLSPDPTREVSRVELHKWSFTCGYNGKFKYKQRWFCGVDTYFRIAITLQFSQNFAALSLTIVMVWYNYYMHWQIVLLHITNSNLSGSIIELCSVMKFSSHFIPWINPFYIPLAYRRISTSWHEYLIPLVYIHMPQEYSWQFWSSFEELQTWLR